MKGNKFGNYTFYRTIGEGAFAKVKCIQLIINYLNYSGNA